MPNINLRTLVPAPNAGTGPNAQRDLNRLTAQGMQLRSQREFSAAARVLADVASALPHEWLAQFNAGAVFLEAGNYTEAIRFFERALALHPFVRGYTTYAHTLALRGDMSGARGAYQAAVALEPDDFDANWGLFEVCQLLDDNAAALHHQRVALAQRTLVSVKARTLPARTTILELCIAGTFQANIPLDFLIDLDCTTVHKLYLGEHPIPALPPYDLIFNTIADAPNATPALDAAARLIAAQDRPALNLPHLVGRTSRDSVAATFAGSTRVAVAPIVRADRASAAQHHPAFPFLIRPLDSHAGIDLAKIDDRDALDRYLCGTVHADEFYLSEFIDYRSADGFFRKYRIMFVAGVPYPVHLAISPRWMIHYYNAPMAEHAWMRDEEHAFMRDLDAVFDGLRGEALREIAHAIPLDYFGIDCAIGADGRVLLFEASTAMIAHLRDPVDLYPYKAQYMPRLVRALEKLFEDRRRPGARA